MSCLSAGLDAEPSTIPCTKEVKEACRAKDEVDNKKAMQNMDKMTILKNEDCKVKDYLKLKSLKRVRDIFATRTMMLKFAGDYLHDDRYRKSSWLCEACDLMVVEDQCHIARCKGYEDLKIDKDIEYNNDDLVLVISGTSDN